MADPQEHDMNMEDGYDEEADSDFEVDGSGPEGLTSSDEDDERDADDAPRRPRKRQKSDNPQAQGDFITELDSGDEATVREQKKARRKGKKDEHEVPEQSGDDSEGWRARTRGMRTREKEERRRNKLASSKGSTIDVNRIWEEMNRPGPLPPPRVEGSAVDQTVQPNRTAMPSDAASESKDTDKENVPVVDGEETIMIKRTYKFAGEVHVEEKRVLKSSAEARLWLSQQDSSKAGSPAGDGKVMNRPLRKISRFDPNFHNSDAFKGAWTSRTAQEAQFKGPKLNVVEKSKMDWAEHVDTEGLQEELDTHAKAKEGYLTRMDFLQQVAERQEAEARVARVKGR
ncbi:uncharacterized protein Z520_02319 [Fonsecaea multimorphosa CBS 102226]|uniref:SWR1-complex protein 5 n=1 Tax=Fonsecaea multimorphosa CBS 102226 TaxID=1442371 RepID=A0A0D2HJV1_9EURO|nr:uncharacterized protein Z520_02319 [Fonsecaea multimorphosa CBS 102226]KIY02181.1 hypothetical protein Z520_02319 [Fonsecaea multimorphosa CBS 102226]OAL29374.1 hypothetical protein AYO22_02268 [Fonsecaea multimorphosa]